jgi:ADP-ribose pyrophosphatase
MPKSTRSMKKLQKWRILHSELVFNHPWYKVRRDRVALPNGTIVEDYFLSERLDVALVFAITPESEVVFVQQYRHGAGEILLELPAGTFDPTVEPANLAASRELREETGYDCDRLIPIGILYDNPVKETNKIHIFLAQDVRHQGEQVLDVTEEIEVVLVPISEVLQLVAQGKLCVAGSVAAVVLGLQFLQKL